jgi:coenzyme F420-reducing hydrogenase delta subunit
VEAVRSALGELGVEKDRAKMFFLPRGLHPEFVDAAQEMNDKITALGPSPF